MSRTERRLHEQRKELRFVTSAEQMIPFLNRIRESKPTNDSSDESDSNDGTDFNDEVSKTSDKLTIPTIVPPTISAVATMASIAVPNIYEEYVNFIDLSVLNPIIDANHCQRDTLIESEISEPTFHSKFPFFYTQTHTFPYTCVYIYKNKYICTKFS